MITRTQSIPKIYIPKPKKIRISKILSDESFVSRPSSIKYALNKTKMIEQDFKIKRAKPKVDDRNSPFPHEYFRNISQFLKNFDPPVNKENIAFELADILDNSEVKFTKVNEYFDKLKEHNNQFLGFWNFIKMCKKQNSKKLKKNNSCIEKKDNEFQDIYKEFDSNVINDTELTQQGKSCKNIFNANPLILSNKTDLFFYFLAKTNNRNIKLYEENYTKYLLKLKELLEYLKLDKDNNIGNKDIKIKNNDYGKKYEQLIEEEKKNLLTKQQIQDKIDEEDAKKMIRETKISLYKLNNDKDFFEDFSCFPSENIKINKIKKVTFKNDKSTIINNNTSSSTFQTKKNNKSNLSNSCFINFKGYLNNSANKNINNSSNKNINNSANKKINNSVNENKNNSINENKNNSINEDKNIINFSLFKKLSSSFYNEIKNNIGASLLQRNSLNIDLEKIKLLNVKNSQSNSEESSNKNLPKINKKHSSKSLLKSKTLDADNIETKNDIKELKKISPEIKPKKKNQIKKVKVPKVVEVYNKIKNKNEISAYKTICNYYKAQELEAKSKKSLEQNIKDIQLLSDFDINRVTCSLFADKQRKLIKKFKKTNSELNKLDKDYAKAICYFKIKGQRKDY